MIKNENVVVFKFGGSLNLMFKIINGLVNSKLDKKALVFRDKLVFNIKEKDNFEVIDFKEDLLQNMDLNEYRIVVIENDFNRKYEDIINQDKYKDLMFFFATTTNKDIKEDIIYCDLENLDKLSIIQKMLKVNEIRKKLSMNKKTKKFKLFK